MNRFAIHLVAALLGFLVGPRTHAQSNIWVPNGTVGTSSNTHVGVGTSSPAHRLDIVGDGSAVVMAARSRHGSAAYMYLYAGTTDDAYGEMAFARSGANAGDTYIGGLASGSIIFRNSGYSDRMAITSNGRIGIGTNGPATQLHLAAANPEIGFSRSSVDVTAYGRIGLTSAYNTYWTSNANFDGTNWIYANTGGWGGYASRIDQHSGHIHFDAASGGTNPISWNTRMVVQNNGNVGIGTTSPSHKLAVNGTVRAKEVVVDTGWSDYVFADDYRLAPLSEVEAHIRENRHLPGIPSAREVAAQGISLGEMQAKLLAKIEELTLHLVAQEKRLQALEAENVSFRRQVEGSR